MRIKNIIMSGIVIGSGILTSACKKVPFQEISRNNLPKHITEKIDSIAIESRKILDNPQYEKFGEDTLNLTGDFYKNTEIFIKELNRTAQSKTPKTCTSHYTIMQPIYTSKSTILVPQTHSIYEDNYINQKVVINSDKVFSKNGKDLYIPVEYYGIPNPKIKE